MGPTHRACYRELGARLRERREAAGVAPREVAAYTGWSRSKVSRIETGHSVITPVDVIFYAGACGLYRKHVMDLLALSRQAESHDGYWLRPREWWDETHSALIFHESTAVQSTSYEPQLIPGLLQTPAYASARMRLGTLSASEVEEAVEVRMARQDILRRPRPARFAFFIHEHALRLMVGSARVMHEQLLQLVLMTALDHVTLRVVLAAAGERSAFGGAFRLFEYREHPPLVYLDAITSGLFIEDRDYVNDYRQLLPELQAVALDEGQSREFTAAVADEFDRGSLRHGGIYQLEEERI